MKKRVAIVGFGRIGRSLFRVNLEKKLFDIVAINDINPDPKNLAYLLQYDSVYGKLDVPIEAGENEIQVGDAKIPIYHATEIEKVPWQDLGVDVVFDASGVHRNVLAAPEVLKKGVKKVVVTHSPEEVDQTLILGVNEHLYKPDKHHVVSSSICDAVAASPILNVLDQNFGIEHGFLTTLHPWLAYQNLLDGPSLSWSMPGQIYYHYAVGRATPGSLIPKPTSAVTATLKTLPHLEGRLRCMSFRVPTPIVGAANFVIGLKKDVSEEDVAKAFEGFEREQRTPVLHLQDDPLVSIDFQKNENNVVLDRRWIQVAGKREVYLVFWYDNEWGYAAHSLRVADFITS